MNGRVVTGEPQMSRARASLAAFVLAACVLAPSRALAYRPFDGTDADVAAEGEYELELGPVGYVHDATETVAIAPWIINNYGIARGHELVLEGRHFLRLGGDAEIPRSRVVDTGLFLKSLIRRGSLQEGSSGLSLATELGPLLPQFHDDTRWGFSFGTIGSLKWDELAIHLNVVNAIERTHQYDLFVGVIVEGPGAWPVRPVAEAFVEQDFVRNGARPELTRSALVGAIWEASDSLAIDLGARGAEGETGRVYEIRAGLTWAIEVVAKSEDPKEEHRGAP